LEKEEKNEHLADSLSEEFCQLFIEVLVKFWNIKSKLQSALQSTIFFNPNDPNFSNNPSFLKI
jgi:hypothetical protein